MKKIISTMLSVAALSATLTGCATTLNVERRTPSELDMSGIKTLAILPAELDKNQYTQDQAMLASKFKNELRQYGENDGKFTILDDATVQNAMNSGFGVQADILIKPRFTRFSVSDSGMTLEQKNSDGTTSVVSDKWTRAIAGNFDVTITRTSDRSVLSTKNFNWFEGNSSPVPKASLANPTQVLMPKMETYAYLTASVVFDMKSYHPIALMESKDKNLKDSMKNAGTLAKAKEYKKAQKAYADIYKSTDDYAAGYNSARLLQVSGKFSESIELLEKLYDRTADRTILKAIEDVRQEKEKQDILDARNSK